MQERRAPHQHVQVLRCHGDSLKFARRTDIYINIYDGELYIVRLSLRDRLGVFLCKYRERV